MAKDDLEEVVKEEAENSPSPTQEHNFTQQWLNIRRRYLRRQRWAQFRELNPVAWFFDELPQQEMYRNSFEVRRSTTQEVRYHWLRQRTGWTFLSKLKSATGVRFAAAAGLVSSVFQAAPKLGEGSNALSFRWLLIAGLCYLATVAWFELFCPLLLKQAIAPIAKSHGSHGRRWLQALVEDELRRWWSKREWWPDPSLLDQSLMEDKTIAAIMSGYGVPAFAGFDVYARAHIEHALDEFAQTTKIKLWCSSGTDRRLEPLFLGYSLEGNRPWMARLTIRHPSADEMDIQKEVPKNDLVIEWCRSWVDISHTLPSRKDIRISADAEGLHHLFDTEADATTFAGIVANWQDTLHPFRRLVHLCLYFASVFAFGWFVILQVSMALTGLTFF